VIAYVLLMAGFCFSFLYHFAAAVSVRLSVKTISGGLALYSGTKQKAPIPTSARVAIFTSAMELGSWSFCRMAQDGLTNGLLTFANGQTIRVIESRNFEVSSG